jgi:hypothetical protein
VFDNAGLTAGFGFTIPIGPTYHAFAVFEPGIPPGANIVSANMLFKSSRDVGSNVTWRIYGVLQPAPAVPASANDCQSAPLTVAFTEQLMAVPGDNWVLDTWYSSLDIAAVLQEIVNQPGYTSASLVILQQRWQGTHAVGREWYAWDTDPADAPILCVDWAFAREVYFKAMHRGEYRKMR